MIGSTLTHYKVTAKLGEGGMGEVYRATDTKLEREVAIKVLPESFAQDKERLARFEREAKVLASLNHPNIAGIYGLEQTGSSHALVLELVEGEDLSDRLKRGPLPLDEALDICKQIAEALEAAHEKGVIHRDLKPGNVKVTADGKVKVLDFGLAKTLDAVGRESTRAGSSGASPHREIDSQSPTITADYTLPGTLLGTAAYMSPEQARGKVVDKRSDIWSFGVVLFECLTGKRLFSGETVTDTIGAVLHKEPDWTALPPNTPPTIQLLLRKCLAKVSKRRLRDIGDAIVDLEQAIADPSSSFFRLSEGALRETASHGGGSRRWPAIAIGLACLATAICVWFVKPAPLSPPAPIRRLSVDLGAESNLRVDYGIAAQLSPDGSTLAYIVGSADGSSLTQFYIRHLNQLKAMPLPAANDTREFCFSPDGQSIAFQVVRGNTLQRVPITGGPASTICEADSVRGIDWSDDGWIVFGTVNGGLLRVRSSGGTPAEPLTTATKGASSHRWPQVLPGGRAVLFTEHTNTFGVKLANLMVQKLPMGKPQLLLTNAYHPHYLPGSGCLVFDREGTILAAAFDPESLTLKGAPVNVVEGVAHDDGGTAQFDVSPEGTLVYLKGGLTDKSYELKWVDREGHSELLLSKAKYGSFSLAPNGHLLAYNTWENEQSDIWIYDLDRKIPNRLTFDPANDVLSVWSPKSESIVFSSTRNPKRVPNLYWKRVDADRGVNPVRLTESQNLQWASSWHPDGKHLAIGETSTGPGADQRIVNLEGDDRSGWKAGEITNFLATPANEGFSSFSRDGHWLAYSSDESGHKQIYVKAFPGGGARTPISNPGTSSAYPVFSRAGDELVFATQLSDDVSRERQVFIARYHVDGDKFVPETPVRWVGGTFYLHPGKAPSYDLSPDGKRLLVRKLADGRQRDPLDHLVWFQNFSEYLKEKVPTGK